MYLDTRGLVTTGIGNLIDPQRLARVYQWRRNSDDQPATPAQVGAEWDQIKGRQQHRSRGGFYFRQFTTLHLPETELERVFRDKAQQFDKQLLRIFPDWDSYPADAQLAMLCHAWALGTGRLRSGWPRYTAACRRRDWATARQQFVWQRMSPRRRQGMEQMFANAANLEEANGQGFRYDLTRVYYPTIITPVTRITAGRP
jgi:hypothetical protein